MIPASLDPGEPLHLGDAFQRFRIWVRRYFWLWVAYQTLKGIITTTVIWVPLFYVWFD